MKTILLGMVLGLTMANASAGEKTKEELYLSLLHKLQYVESYEDLKKMIPNLPQVTADGGENNTEVIVKTKLFGFDSEGEFNFHKNVLVSHGFRIKTPGYHEAHKVFLQALTILNGQVKGLTSEAGLPIPLNDEDASDAFNDELGIYINGIKGNASFQLMLSLRSESTTVQWGAQRVPAPKPK